MQHVYIFSKFSPQENSYHLQFLSKTSCPSSSVAIRDYETMSLPARTRVRLARVHCKQCSLVRAFSDQFRHICQKCRYPTTGPCVFRDVEYQLKIEKIADIADTLCSVPFDEAGDMEKKDAVQFLFECMVATAKSKETRPITLSDYANRAPWSPAASPPAKAGKKQASLTMTPSIISYFCYGGSIV